MSIVRRSFGRTPDGTDVDLFIIRNKSGLEAHITNFGGRIVALYTADRAGRVANVNLGCRTLEDYQARNFFGALVGRVANRIDGARFSLNDKTYNLAVNGDNLSIHGGLRGFDKVVWQAEPVDADGAQPALRLTYSSADGEEGYPGKMDVTVVYTVTSDGALDIAYDAVSDSDTINLTNHAFFNLAGAGNGDILGHEVMLAADAFTASGARSIPTGEIRPVEGTAMDLRRLAKVGERIASGYEQIAACGGFDHNFVLNHAPGEFAKCGEVYDPASGRVMEFFTTEPGVQFYSGNSLRGAIVGAEGTAYGRYAGLCLEAQHYPDAPNHPNFPSIVLRAGDRYRQRTMYRFSWR